jgi:tetratricopeptide (TPR) repeat protein
MTKHDFNNLELSAIRLVERGRHADALKIYYFMSDGDPSLDGGYLGKRIAQCCEALGELHAAKYWYGRAIEQNPVVNSDCVESRNNLGELSIKELLLTAPQISSKRLASSA